MKVLTIMASPREKGNTAALLSWAESALREGGAEIDRVSLHDADVQPCRGCFACQAMSSLGRCIHVDDVQAIMARMIEANAILFGAPLYCWGFPSPLKALLDRGICLVRNFGTEGHSSALEGRKAGLIVSCGGPEEGNADLVVTQFKRMCRFVKTEDAGALVVPFCQTPEDLGAGSQRKTEVLAQALLGSGEQKP